MYQRDQLAGLFVQWIGQLGEWVEEEGSDDLSVVCLPSPPVGNTWDPEEAREAVLFFS